MQRRFAQLDVFSGAPFKGNPLAVVLDAQGLTEAQMRDLARWTHLSETTFVLPPGDTRADYRVRIFTPSAELPFAGHPTLGTCRAWLSAGGVPRQTGRVIQECAIGLVEVRQQGERLAFAAPPLRRSGPIEDTLLAQIRRALGLRPEQIRGHQWVDNGAGFCAVLLDSAQAVLAVQPDYPALGALKVGIVGPHPQGDPADFEVRAFVPTLGIGEDPVTGSLNAGLAQWLLTQGLARDPYTVRQGTCLGHDGRVELGRQGEQVWVAGQVVDRIQGQIEL